MPLSNVENVCRLCRTRHSRHTFGTLLNANGENPKVVQELLRHASLKVTTAVSMQAVGPQKREAQSNLLKLVRKGAVLEIKPA